jgi:hypothetical protein
MNIGRLDLPMDTLEEAALDLELDGGIPASTAAEAEPSESDEHDPINMAEIPPQARSPPLRWKKTREVQLFHGNLVLDCKVPQRLLNQIPHSPCLGRDEFTHVRYSAVTWDSSQSYNDRYALRAHLFARPRQIEIMIAVTLNNEDDILLRKNTSRDSQKHSSYKVAREQQNLGPRILEEDPGMRGQQ